MAKAIELEAAKTINALHAETAGHLRRALAVACEIGERLATIKERLPHGQFGAWVDGNLEFSHRTATRYMQLHAKRHEIEGLTITDAYRALKSDTVSNFAVLDRAILDALRAELPTASLERATEIRHIVTAGAQVVAGLLLDIEAQTGALLRRTAHAT